MEDGTYVKTSFGKVMPITYIDGYTVASDGIFSVHSIEEYEYPFIDNEIESIPSGRLFGVWTDPETDIVYLDYVEHVSKLEDALAIAKNNGELAVWDCGMNEEVRVNA